MKRFKSITAVPITDLGELSSPRLTDILCERPIADPSGNVSKTIGFSKPSYFGESIVFDGQEVRAFNVEFREKVVPAAAVNKKVKERAEQIEKAQGYKPGRKQMSNIKEDIIHEMLGTAFIRANSVLCFVSHDYLYICSTSKTAVGDIISLLLGETDCKFGRIETDMIGWMTNAVMCLGEASEPFTIGNDAALVGNAGSVVRLKGVDLTSEPVTDPVNGYLAHGFAVKELAVVHENDMGKCGFRLCMIDGHVGMKGVWLDSIEAESVSGDAAEELFGSVLYLMSETLRRIMDDLRAGEL